jgi:hypothetical protein
MKIVQMAKWKSLVDPEQWLDILVVFFSLFGKIQQTKVKLLFLIVVLLELK